MRKKSDLLFLLTMIMAAILSVGFISCGDDDAVENPDSGQPISPSTTVSDPEGTISLSMRNSENGKTYLDDIYISNENFSGAYFASVGAVKGLGNVSIIPTLGWAGQMSVIAGNGYVAYCNNQFYRIYVVSDIVGTSGGIIGADIKYQKPFKGVDEAISIDEKSLTFKGEGGSQSLVFNNKNIIVFDAVSDQNWCRVRKSSTTENYFLYNAITIDVDANTSLETDNAIVTLTTSYGKKEQINVMRLGDNPILALSESEKVVSGNDQSFYVTITTNYDFSNLVVSSTDSWIKAEIIDNTRAMQAKASQVKFIGEEEVSQTRASGSSGVSNFQLKINTECNYNGSSRTGSVVLQSVDGKSSQTLNIIQEGSTLYFEESEKTVTCIASNYNRVGFSTSLNLNEIQVSCDKEWCKASLLTDRYYREIRFDCDANDNESQRTAQIKLTTTKSSDLVATLNVFQEGAVLSFQTDTVWFDRNNGNQSITINTTIPSFKMTSSDDSWCTVANNGSTIVVRTNANSSLRERKATLWVKNSKDETMSKTLTVVQSKYAVGDEYREGNVEGTVCYMNNSERSIYQELDTIAAWSTEYVETGANSQDGRVNTAIIKAIPNWEYLYPAFAIVDGLNRNGVTGWYMPSRYELEKASITTTGYEQYYWSSSERDKSYACYRYDYRHYYDGDKKSTYSIIAFRRF